MGRKLMVGTLAALVLGICAAPASAAPSWSDGPVERSHITNCQSIIFPPAQTEDGAWTWTGQYLDPANPPDTNSVFYIHVVAGAVGNACSGQYVHFELLGPPVGTILVNATVAHPIICWAINWNTNPASAQQESPYGSGGNCPVAPESGGIAGGLSFDAQTSPTNAQPWPLPQGKGWEIQIPVQIATPMSGGFGACNDCNTFDTKILDGNSSPELFPRQGLFVNNTVAGGGTNSPGGTGASSGAGTGFKPNAQFVPPAAAAAKKCKKGQKLKKGKCKKKKKKKK